MMQPAGHQLAELNVGRLLAPTDDPRVADLVRLVERLRDEPLQAICRDPRDGTPFGNSHVVRSGAVHAAISCPTIDVQSVSTAAVAKPNFSKAFCASFGTKLPTALGPAA